MSRTLTDSFAGIAPASTPGYIAAQVAGALIAVLLVRTLYPTAGPQ